MIEVSPGANVLLPLSLADGAGGFFPQAEVYDSAGTAIAGSPFDLTHVARGLYQALFAAPVAGDYSVVYVVYSDAGHLTLAAQYARADEHLRVFSAATGSGSFWTTQEQSEIRGALGVSGTRADPAQHGVLQEIRGHEENVVDEALARDSEGLITSAVRRQYDNPADAIADNAPNAVKVVTVTAVNNAGLWDKLTRSVSAGAGGFQVTALDLTPVSPLEVGESMATPAFTAAFSNAPTTAVLDDSLANPQQNIIGSPTAFTSVNTYVQTVIGGTVIWTVTADDGSGADSRNVSATWLPGVFTGLIASAGPYSEADIEAMTKRLLSSSQLGQIILTPATEYIVHAYPASYGAKVPADFQIGTLGPGDMTEIQTALSITNAFGVTLDYRVARSDFAQLAPGGVEFEVFN